jgi:hypothetical protein
VKSKECIELETPEAGPSRSQARSVRSEGKRGKTGQFAGLEKCSNMQICQDLFNKVNNKEIEREVLMAEIEVIYALINKYTD